MLGVEKGRGLAHVIFRIGRIVSVVLFVRIDWRVSRLWDESGDGEMKVRLMRRSKVSDSRRNNKC